MKAVVIGVRPYEFEDERTGRNISGISVFYLPTGSMEPSEGNGIKGYIPIKESLNLSCLKKFPSVPGIYELSYIPRPSSKGIMQKLADAEYICDIDGNIAKSKV